MPALSRYYIWASLIYLALGFTLGGLLLVNKGVPFYPPTWRGLPSHVEFLLLGWMLQLVLGVAFWILPRLAASQPRGNEGLAWLAFILINLGIWLVVAQSVFLQDWFSSAGRACEAAGALAFLVAAWRRIRPFGA